MHTLGLNGTSSASSSESMFIETLLLSATMTVGDCLDDTREIGVACSKSNFLQTSYLRFCDWLRVGVT